MTGVTPASFLKTEMKCEVLEKPHVAAIVSRDAESVLRSSLRYRNTEYAVNYEKTEQT